MGVQYGVGTPAFLVLGRTVRASRVGIGDFFDLSNWGSVF